ncbi:MAG: SDR family NAD(P)-dependent oxidoreductase [Calditrichae bacterium]|nr:SDR family NAD(P)-dependent oxidoreductase [Calditrichia bacterium]
MENKICLITGCNTGIGKQTAIQLAKLNYTIITLVRDSEKSRMAFEDIKTRSNNQNVKMFYVDFSSPDSIISVVEKVKGEYSKIDVLINNAGVLKRNLQIGYKGYEMTMVVNYFAPFLLTNLLLPLIEKSTHGRIINLSSELYKKGETTISKPSSAKKFDGNKVYADSKLLIVLFTKELAKRLNGKNITVNSVHPGVVGTDVFRDYPKWFSKLLNLFISKPEVGAEPIVYLATSDEVSNITGEYFSKTQLSKTIDIVNDEKVAEQIWKETETILETNNQ